MYVYYTLLKSSIVMMHPCFLASKIVMMLVCVAQGLHEFVPFCFFCFLPCGFITLLLQLKALQVIRQA